MLNLIVYVLIWQRILVEFLTEMPIRRLVLDCMMMMQGEHTVGKQECQGEHPAATSRLEESVILSPDYLRLGRKRKSDQMKVPPPFQQQQPPPPQQQQQSQQQLLAPPQTGSVDLDSSQVQEKRFTSRTVWLD